MSAPADGTIGREVDAGLVATLEALLFASTEPLTMEELQVALADLDVPEIEAGLEALGKSLAAPGRGLRLERIAGGFRLTTRQELAGALQALFRFRNQKRLSPASLDVLAIIAYAQPITAPEIHEIRGTDPSYSIHTLLDRGLVRMVGRKRVIGRPILWGTTREFLVHFGLDSLEDLPPVKGFDTRVAPLQARLFPAEFAGPSAEVLGDEDAVPADAAPMAGPWVEAPFDPAASAPRPAGEE